MKMIAKRRCSVRSVLGRFSRRQPKAQAVRVKGSASEAGHTFEHSDWEQLEAQEEEPEVVAQGVIR